ncbi:hypothetical protein RQP46_004214 [Phenoliferia psychrophenolica]
MRCDILVAITGLAAATLPVHAKSHGIRSSHTTQKDTTPAQLISVLKEHGLPTSCISSVTAANAQNHGKATGNSPLTSLRKSVKSSKLTSHPAPQSKKFEGWKTFKANGGSWFEIETNYAPNVIPDAYADEFTWCSAVGFKSCGPVLEKHYSTFVTRADIDKVAKYGVNTLRIPLTYAAFYAVPGSGMYHGNQLAILKDITEYAIQNYDMHIVVGKALDFIESSTTAAFTLSPINEPSDDLAAFGSVNSVTYPNGVNYLNTYLRAVYALIEARNMATTLMIPDAFAGAAYWAPFWPAGSNIAIDSHFYYFAASGVYASYTGQIACGQAAGAVTTFPVFVGEFSTASYYNNTLAERATIYQTQVFAWSKYLSGGDLLEHPVSQYRQRYIWTIVDRQRRRRTGVGLLVL